MCKWGALESLDSPHGRSFLSFLPFELSRGGSLLVCWRLPSLARGLATILRRTVVAVPLCLERAISLHLRAHLFYPVCVSTYGLLRTFDLEPASLSAHSPRASSGLPRNYCSYSHLQCEPCLCRLAVCTLWIRVFTVRSICCSGICPQCR